ncbi:MAG: flavodoxin domain-containing protein [Bacteroidota bacterium]
MNGAIFYSGKYGSTKQYAEWISEATALPVFDINKDNTDLTKFDFLVLGSSVLYFKLSNRHWVKKNFAKLNGRVKILFSVSGAGPSERLNTWVSNSYPVELLSQVEHIGLRGKLDHSKISWPVKLMLWIGSLFNSNREASKDERYGFDYMDKSSIEPIVKRIKELQAEKQLA